MHSLRLLGVHQQPDDYTNEDSAVPITMELCVDDFIYSSSSNKVEEKFQSILSCLINVDFMRTVEWFLGTHLFWCHTLEETTVYMHQSGFSRNLVKQFDMQDCNTTPVYTPCKSGCPINSIKGENLPKSRLPHKKRRTQSYQSLVGSIGWLSNITRPNMASCHLFLSSYTYCPTTEQLKAVLHTLYCTTFTQRTTTALSPLPKTHSSSTCSFTTLTSWIWRPSPTLCPRPLTRPIA